MGMGQLGRTLLWERAMFKLPINKKKLGLNMGYTGGRLAVADELR